MLLTKYMVVNMDLKKMLFLQWKCDARLRIGQESVSLDHCIAKRCVTDQRCTKPATCWAALVFLLTWVRCWKVSGHSRLLCDIWPGKPDAVLGSGKASRGKRDSKRSIRILDMRRVPMPDTGSETDSLVARLRLEMATRNSQTRGGQARAWCSVPVDPLIGESWRDACGVMYLYTWMYLQLHQSPVLVHGTSGGCTYTVLGWDFQPAGCPAVPRLPASLRPVPD
jgi:hypothetical protein